MHKTRGRKNLGIYLRNKKKIKSAKSTHTSQLLYNLCKDGVDKLLCNVPDWKYFWLTKSQQLHSAVVSQKIAIDNA